MSISHSSSDSSSNSDLAPVDEVHQPPPGCENLAFLRSLMTDPAETATEAIQAYIISNHDGHMSEYLAERDKRLKFITGFAGSAGTAVVTDKAALMWTDPRYFIQAKKELRPEWTLMKMGVLGVPNEAQWLCANLPEDSFVGADPKTIPYTLWVSMKLELEKFKINLIPVTRNLVDLVWSRDRPKAPLGMITTLPKEYSGMLSSEKVQAVRSKMKENGVDLLVVTALDDIAWLLNLRGSDICYNPVFFAFVVLSNRKVHLFIDEKKIDLAVRNHFNKEDLPISLHPYDNIYLFIKRAVESETGGISKVWLPSSTNFWIYNSIPSEKRFCECSPIALMKAIKNEVEAQGMKNAHIKDGIALCQYFHWLENEIKSGTVKEIEAAHKLETFRRLDDSYVGPSFETISASGPNAAIAHYTPNPSSNRTLSVDEIYLCDTGAQFKDGTTDVTRTMHFGNPDYFQRECFTRVFKGLAHLTTCKFPTKIKGNTLDVLARKYLWDVGLDYGHGTGHGIGSFLNVHEGPMGISWRPYPDDPGLQENMFLSNEPGFYSEGEFGIRIENIVQITPAATPHNFQDRGFLTFSTVTMCPIQTKMLVLDMLTEHELEFLNSYHAVVHDTLGPILKKNKLNDVYEWLKRETAPVERLSSTSAK